MVDDLEFHRALTTLKLLGPRAAGTLLVPGETKGQIDANAAEIRQALDAERATPLPLMPSETPGILPGERVHRHRERGMRNVMRVAMLGGAMMLFAVTPASAVTVIGQTFTPPTGGTCGENTYLQSVSPGSQYTVPYDGVITSWSHQAAPDNQPSSLRFKVGRFAGADAFTIVGESAPKTPAAGQLNTYPDVSIPVRAGDLIGFYPGAGGPRCAVNLIANYSVAWDTGGVDVVAGTTATFTPPQPNLQLDVSATLELDGDQDGFGDETEELCPTDASKQTECDPPETFLVKRPQNKTGLSRVTYKFSSDEPGSTFQCKFDKKPFKGCVSPKNVKVDEGKHKFKVVATDAVGNVDPSAAKDKFKVVD